MVKVHMQGSLLSADIAKIIIAIIIWCQIWPVSGLDAVVVWYRLG